MATKQKGKPPKPAKARAKKAPPPRKAVKPSKAAKPLARKSPPSKAPAKPARKAATAPAGRASQTAKSVSPTPSSATPSSALSRSIPTPFAGSQTDGGVRYLSVQDLVELHKAVCAEFGGTQAHPGVIDLQFGLLNAVQRPQVTTL